MTITFEDASKAVEYWPRDIAFLLSLPRLSGGTDEGEFGLFFKQTKELRQQFRLCEQLIRDHEAPLAKLRNYEVLTEGVTGTSAHMIALIFADDFLRHVWSGIALASDPACLDGLRPENRRECDPPLRFEHMETVVKVMESFPKFDAEIVSKMIRLERLKYLDEATPVEKESTEHPDEKLVADAKFCFQSHGKSMFYIKGFGEDGNFPSLKGIRQIHRLLQSAEKAVAMDLLVNIDGNPAKDDPRSEQPVFDDEAMREIGSRLAQAKQDYKTSLSANDTVDAEHCREEIENINTELGKATFRGKSHDLNSENKKMRSLIHGTLETAYAKLRSEIPPMTELATHLEAAIYSEGGSYIYRSASSPPLKWETESKVSDQIR